MFLLIAFLIAGPAYAVEPTIASTIESAVGNSSDTAPHAIPNDVKNLKTFQLLTCMQGTAPQGLFWNPKHNLASCAIEKLSPSIDAAFKAYGKNENEQLMILSNAIEESRFFTKLTEGVHVGSGPASDDCKDYGLRGQIAAAFAKASAAGTKKYAKSFVGCGYFQLTGLDNRASAIDYLIQKWLLQDPSPRWQPYWTYRDAKGDTQKLKAGTEDPRAIDAFKKKYKEDHNIDINVYDLFDDPTKLCVPEADLEGKELAEKYKNKKLEHLNSNEVLIETTMAFWDGSCKEMKEYADNPLGYKGSFDPDNFDGGDERLALAAMDCVHRSAIYKRSLLPKDPLAPPAKHIHQKLRRKKETKEQREARMRVEKERRESMSAFRRIQWFKIARNCLHPPKK